MGAVLGGAAIVGAAGIAGSLLGGGTPSNRSSGFSSKTSERLQRLQEANARFGFKGDLDQQALINFFVGGGNFQQLTQGTGDGGSASGFIGSPTGPAFNIVNQGLQGEEGNSLARQGIAQQLLGQVPADLAAQNSFLNAGLGQAGGQFGTESALLQSLLGGAGGLSQNNAQFTDTLGQLTGSPSDLISSRPDFQGIALRQGPGVPGEFTGDRSFIEAGGASDLALQQQLSDVFQGQREIGNSNLQQQFSDAVQALGNQASDRGLRFNDTPIQDRGNRLAEEFSRNATNFETALSGQESQALATIPFQQNLANNQQQLQESLGLNTQNLGRSQELSSQSQGLNQQDLSQLLGLNSQNLQQQLGVNSQNIDFTQLLGGLQGQGQGQFLNVLNSFSNNINRGFDSSNALFSQNQFGAQFQPAAFSGGALQNLTGLISGSDFASGVPNFAPPSPGVRQAGLAQTGLQGFSGALGKGLAGIPLGAFGGSLPSEDVIPSGPNPVTG